MALSKFPKDVHFPNRIRGFMWRVEAAEHEAKNQQGVFLFSLSPQIGPDQIKEGAASFHSMKGEVMDRPTALRYLSMHKAIGLVLVTDPKGFLDHGLIGVGEYDSRKNLNPAPTLFALVVVQGETALAFKYPSKPVKVR